LTRSKLRTNIVKKQIQDLESVNEYHTILQQKTRQIGQSTNPIRFTYTWWIGHTYREWELQIQLFFIKNTSAELESILGKAAHSRADTEARER